MGGGALAIANHVCTKGEALVRTGKVIFFSPAGKYGRIARSDGGGSVFFGTYGIISRPQDFQSGTAGSDGGDHPDHPAVGDLVEFELRKDGNGRLEAVAVRKVVDQS